MSARPSLGLTSAERNDMVIVSTRILDLTSAANSDMIYVNVHVICS